LKLPRGGQTRVASHGALLRMVVVAGSVEHSVAQTDRTLPVGSYVESEIGAGQQLVCREAGECLLYLRMSGPVVLR
ncbi:MAG: DUF4437 domain-containing protein, partial [Myxococcota bacterium]